MIREWRNDRAFVIADAGGRYRDDRHDRRPVQPQMAVCRFGGSSDSAGAGRYVYYVNGIRVSAGFAVLTENLALFLLMGLFIVLVPIRAGMMLGERMLKAYRSGRPAPWALIVWGLCVLAGAWALSGAVSVLSRPRPPMRSAPTADSIVCAVSILVILTGLAGIVQHLIAAKRKK